MDPDVGSDFLSAALIRFHQEGGRGPGEDQKPALPQKKTSPKAQVFAILKGGGVWGGISRPRCPALEPP